MSDEQTLEPTIKRRQQARKEGRVAATPYLGSAITWLVFFVVVFVTAGWIADYVRQSFDTLSNATPELFAASVASDGLLPFVRESGLAVGAVLIPILLAIAGLAALSRVAQFGFLWVPHRLTPDLSRLNPAQRMANLFSLDSLVQLMRGMLLIGIACVLVGYGIWSQREEVAASLNTDVSSTVRILSVWGIRLGETLLLFAILDFAYQRWRFENSLRMSPEEMRAEVKAVEGSGQLTAERRNRWQQITANPSELPS